MFQTPSHTPRHSQDSSTSSRSSRRTSPRQSIGNFLRNRASRLSQDSKFSSRFGSRSRSSSRSSAPSSSSSPASKLPQALLLGNLAFPTPPSCSFQPPPSPSTPRDSIDSIFSRHADSDSDSDNTSSSSSSSRPPNSAAPESSSSTKSRAIWDDLGILRVQRSLFCALANRENEESGFGRSLALEGAADPALQALWRRKDVEWGTGRSVQGVRQDVGEMLLMLHDEKIVKGEGSRSGGEGGGEGTAAGLPLAAAAGAGFGGASAHTSVRFGDE